MMTKVARDGMSQLETTCFDVMLSFPDGLIIISAFVELIARFIANNLREDAFKVRNIYKSENNMGAVLSYQT